MRYGCRSRPRSRSERCRSTAASRARTAHGSSRGSDDSTRRRPPRGGRVAAIAVAVAPACGTLTGADDTDSDAGTADAAAGDEPRVDDAENDAAATCEDGDGGLLANGGFEESCGGGWIDDGTAILTQV